MLPYSSIRMSTPRPALGYPLLPSYVLQLPSQVLLLPSLTCSPRSWSCFLTYPFISLIICLRFRNASFLVLNSATNAELSSVAFLSSSPRPWAFSVKQIV
uniref:Uncharacterized protein n=1 Tax=Arundo donax TaxID=35708 RepID=A0A0A8XV11_ARUDO